MAMGECFNWSALADHDGTAKEVDQSPTYAEVDIDGEK